jgi:AcrR family transcriptional regulator
MRRVTRAEAAARTRSDLLDAAAEVFAEKGFAGASLDEIAERAGRTKGAVYANFSNKDDLFVALLDRSLATMHDELAARLSAVAGPDDLLGALRDSAGIPDQRSRTDFLLMWEFRLYALRNPALAERLAEHERLAHQLCERQVKASLEQVGVEAPLSADRLASILLCLESGLELYRHLDPTMAEDAMSDALLVLLSALKKPR